MLGLEYQDDPRQDQTNVNATIPANDVVIAASGWRTGVYFQDEWALRDALSATWGLRIDRNNVTGTSLSPRLGLIWQATPTTTLKALYGGASRPPNVYERDYSDGVSQVANPALNSETIDTLELVLDQRVGQTLLLRGSVYQWTMHGLVTLGLDPVSGLSQYQNGEGVKANGVEISGDKTWDWTELLELEITEGAVMEDSGATLATLNALNRHGLQIALDNFGTGYSSMNHLKRMPLNNLKVDKSFVKGLPHDQDNHAIVRALLSLAKSFGFNVTAEGVETLQQAEALKALACDTLQGFYFSKPVAAAEIPAPLTQTWLINDPKGRTGPGIVRIFSGK
jgi:EAL domain/TonB dependent receptor-like, beta-barrel